MPSEPTSIDHVRYDLLVRDALRGVVRQVLSDVARNGLPGEHHFYVSFDTRAEGVRMSSRLKAQYPDEMTIVLQHQFWDLTVTELAFEVGMSFGGVPEKLHVPLHAVKGFADPSVNFGLEFQIDGEPEDMAGSPEPKPAALPVAKPERAGKRGARPQTEQDLGKRGDLAASGTKLEARGADPSPAAEAERPAGAEVVRLDRFRKK